MDNLELEIKKQIEYCINFNRYKAGFFVSDTSKINKIKEILDGVNKIVGEMYVVKLKENGLFVGFLNGHSMRVLVASDHWRGCKFNGLLIDKSIEQGVKDYIIYPTIIPRYIEVDGVIEFEDRLETNKRIIEVEI